MFRNMFATDVPRRRQPGRRLLAASLLAGLALSTVAAPVAAAPAAPAPAASPAATGQATSADAAAQDLGYDYNYSTGIPWPQSALWTPQQVMTEVGDNFRSYFPFDSNCEVIRVGFTCDLYSLGTANPVLVTARTATGFQFRSLAGHAEGADRWIAFEFYATGTGAQIDIRLRATAGGPYTAAADLTIASGAAFSFWRQFADNVGAKFGA